MKISINCMLLFFFLFIQFSISFIQLTFNLSVIMIDFNSSIMISSVSASASVDFDFVNMTFIESFNAAVKTAFELMLDVNKKIIRKRTSLRKKQQMIQWLIEIILERELFVIQVKRRFWVRVNFVYDEEKLYRNFDRFHQHRREIMIEIELWDLIIIIHNSFEHVEQNFTFKEIKFNYYDVNRDEMLFLIKLCEICQRKHQSRFKKSLISIVFKIFFQRVQMNLIDMRAIFDRSWI